MNAVPCPISSGACIWMRRSAANSIWSGIGRVTAVWFIPTRSWSTSWVKPVVAQGAWIAHAGTTSHGQGKAAARCAEQCYRCVCSDRIQSQYVVTEQPVDHSRGIRAAADHAAGAGSDLVVRGQVDAGQLDHLARRATGIGADRDQGAD